MEEKKSFDINWIEYHTANIKANDKITAEKEFNFKMQEGLMGDTYSDSSDITIDEVA